MHSKGLMASAFALGVLFVMAIAAPSWAGLKCTGPTGAVEIKGTVHAGPGCDLSGATVKGKVIVDPGGGLRTKAGTNTEITGNVEGKNAAYLKLFGRTLIGGTVRLMGTTKGVEVESGGSVKGNVEIQRGVPEATLIGETVGGNVQMLANSTPAEAEAPGIPEVRVIFSTVGGNVELGNNSLSGDLENRLEVEGTSVAGNLLVFNNTESNFENNNAVRLLDNHVGGNAELLNNTMAIGSLTGISVFKNVVTNILNCVGNVPPPGGKKTLRDRSWGSAHCCEAVLSRAERTETRPRENIGGPALAVGPLSAAHEARIVSSTPPDLRAGDKRHGRTDPR